jgi:hypothetical protein
MLKSANAAVRKALEGFIAQKLNCIMKHKLFRRTYSVDCNEVIDKVPNEQKIGIFTGYPLENFEKWLNSRYHLFKMIDDLDLMFIKSFPFSTEIPIINDTQQNGQRVSLDYWVKELVPKEHYFECRQKALEFKLLQLVAAFELEKVILNNNKYLKSSTKATLIAIFHKSCFIFDNGKSTFSLGSMYKPFLKMGYDDVAHLLDKMDNNVAKQITTGRSVFYRKCLWNAKMGGQEYIDVVKRQKEFWELKKEELSLKTDQIPHPIVRNPKKSSKIKPDSLKDIWATDIHALEQYDKLIELITDVNIHTGCTFAEKINEKLYWNGTIKGSRQYLGAFFHVMTKKGWINKWYSAPDYQRIIKNTFNIELNVKPLKGIPTGNFEDKYLKPFTIFPIRKG